MPNFSVNDADVARRGLIDCDYRAAEWGREEMELAAHDLRQRLGAARA